MMAANLRGQIELSRLPARPILFCLGRRRKGKVQRDLRSLLFALGPFALRPLPLALDSWPLLLAPCSWLLALGRFALGPSPQVLAYLLSSKRSDAVQTEAKNYAILFPEADIEGLKLRRY